MKTKKFLSNFVRIVSMLMAAVMLFSMTACASRGNADVADASAEPTQNVTAEPTQDVTAEPTEEPRQEITPLPKDAKIVKWETPQPFIHDMIPFTSIRTGYGMELELYRYLSSSEFLKSIEDKNVLFEVAFGRGYFLEDEMSAEELEADLKARAEEFAGMGYSMKWAVCKKKGANGIIVGFLYGYLTVEQILNYPGTRPDGYEVAMLEDYTIYEGVHDYYKTLDLRKDADFMYLDYHQDTLTLYPGL